MPEKFGDIIYTALKNHYDIKHEEFVVSFTSGKSLFEALIAVILSQNTNDKNAIKALSALKSELGEITPENILRIRDRLEDLLRPAGLQKNRAGTILKLAEIFSTKGYEDELRRKIQELPVEKAREILRSLPGVGDKTSDVILLMFFNKPVFPVDTHIRRITLRMGVVQSSSYNNISKFWLQNTSPENLLPLHLLLITHGREICKARKPLCESCPISEHCRRLGL